MTWILSCKARTRVDLVVFFFTSISAGGTGVREAVPYPGAKEGAGATEAKAVALSPVDLIGAELFLDKV